MRDKIPPTRGDFPCPLDSGPLYILSSAPIFTLTVWGKPMKFLKGLAWSLPTVALALGGLALTAGFSGAVTGSELVAPVVTEDGSVAASKTVSGETWEPMATVVTKYKGSARGF